MTAWDSTGSSSRVDPNQVVLVEGSSFCVSNEAGDISRGAVHGLFVQDTRVLSRWDLYVNDERVRPLAGVASEGYTGRFLGIGAVAGDPRRELVVDRRRWILAAGMREEITLRNFGREPVESTIAVAFAADFADVFEVKDRRVPVRSVHRVESDGRCTIETHWRGHQRAVVVQAPEARFADGRALFRSLVPAHGTWSVTIGIGVEIDGVAVAELPLDRPIEESASARRLRQWRLDVPVVRSSNQPLATTLRRSQQDLGSLRIADPTTGREVVAAGAPWFMALFGRDSLLTALMSLPLDPGLALDTLHTLAQYQGERVNPLTEEEPGRILHEVRFGLDATLALGGERAYYGTADATPLFVMLLGELRNWGLPPDELAALLPHADRALDWITGYGDRDGDGFVEYARSNEQGLANQGWKDSWDGINYADGRLAGAPVALCEVQGYVYAAYLARARLAGDDRQRQHWVERARQLKRDFNERFWIPERDYYAIALDGDKRQVDACASNMGHCLLTGIVDADKAPAVARQLMSERMFTGWGIRTLASDMGAFNPASYHNGSVWPHDNALIAAGLMRYGFVAEAQRVASALLEAAEHFGGRLPELFCGFDRDEYAEPIPYPTSCSPQAWASAAPVHLVRTLLRFDPDAAERRVRLAPAWPPDWGSLELAHVPLAGSRLALSLTAEGAELSGLPPDFELNHQPEQAGADLE